MRLNEFNFEETALPLVMEAVIVNSIIEEICRLSTGLQSWISSLNLKYLVVYNIKPLQKTLNAIP